MKSDTASPHQHKPTLRVPPHSSEAEKGVLGSVLLDAVRVMDLCITAALVPESFYFEPHRRLFGEFVAMHHAGLAIDLLTVVERLRTAGHLDAIGGASFLEGLVDATPTSAHAEYYIDIVRQKHLLREVIRCARNTERLCFEGGQSADLIVGEAEQAFFGITKSSQEWGVEWRLALDGTMEHIDRLFRMEPGSVTGLPTGFRNLDKKLLGFKAKKGRS